MESLFPDECSLFGYSWQPKFIDFGLLPSSTFRKFCTYRLSSSWILIQLKSCFQLEGLSSESVGIEGYFKKNLVRVGLPENWSMKVVTTLYDPIRCCTSSLKITCNSCSLMKGIQFIIGLSLAFCTCKFDLNLFCQLLSFVESW